MHDKFLFYFNEVAHQGSIRKAAAHLNVSSSSVNRKILSIEENLGVRLFERHADGVELTSAGRVVLEHCRQTIFDYRQTLSKIEDIRELRAGHVTLITLDSVAESILPEVLDKFIEEHPQITFTIRMSNLIEVTESLTDGRADIGISFTRDLPPGLRVHSEKSTPIGAIMRPDHPLAGRDALSIADLVPYQLVRSYDGPDEHSIWDEASEETGVTPLTQTFTSSFTFAREMILRNHGIGTYTKIGYLREIERGDLVYIPIQAKVFSSLRIGVITSARSGSSPAVSLLCRSLSRSLRTLRLDS